MKRIWIAAVWLLCVCLLASCGQKPADTSGQNTVSVYYINKEATKISPVENVLGAGSTATQVAAVIEMLKESPVKLSLWTPVNGYEIQEWQITDTQLTLDMSADYKKIEPTAEVLMRAAIVRTLTQVSGIEYVLLTVNGDPLTDNLGGMVGPMTADMFIDNAGNEINAYEKVRLNLYFANETGDGLVKVTTAPVVYNSNISLEKLVVEQLIMGPGEEMEDAYPVINPVTKVLGVMVKDGTCYVNLDSGFMTQYYEVTGDVMIYAVVNSLAELSNVNKVQFAVNGETKVIFREKYDLELSYERNLDLVYEN